MSKALSMLWRFLTRRLVLRVVGLGVGGMFIYASLDKVAHPDRFADFRANPQVKNSLASSSMPWIKIDSGFLPVTLLTGCEDVFPIITSNNHPYDFVLLA